MYIPKVTDEKEREILDFIQRRFPKDGDWTTGNCYWFAVILGNRFFLEKYYQPKKGHFVAGDGHRFYDWTGRVGDAEDDIPILYDEMWDTDRTWAARLFRDCAN